MKNAVSTLLVAMTLALATAFGQNDTASPVTEVPDMSDARVERWKILKDKDAVPAREDATDATSTTSGDYVKSLDFGDTLVVTIRHLHALVEAGKVDPAYVKLHLDEIDLSAITAKYCCDRCDDLTFVINRRFLDRKTQNQIKQLAGLSDQAVGVALFYGKDPWLDCCTPSLNMHLRGFRENLEWSIAFSVLLLGLLIFLGWKTNLLHGRSLNGHAANRPFSLSRVQLAFWTFIILDSYFYIYICTGETNALNLTALILLGISSTTTAIGSVIDTSDANKGYRSTKSAKGRNLIMNILSDDEGVSIHRLQTVIFNLIFGIIFMEAVLSELTMPDFSTEQLALLGISNGTYTALKTNERSGASRSDIPPAPSEVPAPASPPANTDEVAG